MRDDRAAVVGTLVGVGALVGVTGLILFARKKSSRGSPRDPIFPGPSTLPPTVVEPEPGPGHAIFASGVEQWRAVLDAQRADADGKIPLRFLLQWLTQESGGNPCSTGFTGAQDPVDKLYKFEAGIGQQYFEAPTRDALDTKTANGVMLKTLRAACSAQHQTRPLTVAEKAANVQAFLGDVRRFRALARKQIAVAGLSWPESGDDFWRAVKLEHALPCVAKSFLGPAAQHGVTTFAGLVAFVNGLDVPTYIAMTKAAGCWPAMQRFYGHGVVNALANSAKCGAAAWSLG